MTLAEIRAIIAVTPKGANIWAIWERPVKLRVAYKGMPLTKRTKMLVRIAVDYDRKDDVIEGRANGDLPAENAGLKGVTWIDFPTILQAVKTGKYQLRLEVGTFNNAKTVVQYFLDGQEVKKEDYEHTMLANETAKREDFAGTFNIDIDNIRQIHRHVVETEGEAEGEAQAV
jgi:hypothetical protein